MNAEGFKQSRIGKAPVNVPVGVDVEIEGRRLTVKGSKGVLVREFHSAVEIKREGGLLRVFLNQLDNEGRAVSGLCRSILNNMVIGVSKGFERRLEIIGTGYRAEMRGSTEMLLNLGYRHAILYELPVGVTAEVSKDNKITLRSNDKETIGRAAAKIRSFRAPEPYKGKGIRYMNEFVIRKAGKAGGK